MEVWLYKTGLDELIPCIITESSDDGTKRIKLLCDSLVGKYKAFENVHTKGENLTRGMVTLEVINTLNTSYIVKGEIYELIGVNYSPASHMGRESFMYKIRIHDGRIGSYRPDCFKMMVS